MSGVLDVLTQYEQLVVDGHSNQTLLGDAGTAHVATAGEIKTAQMKIQTRFQAVNDLLRQAAGSYTNNDADIKSDITAVAGSLRFT